jgi:hypothetical protein
MRLPRAARWPPQWAAKANRRETRPEKPLSDSEDEGRGR